MDYFQNKQWRVTEWGLQSFKPGAPYEYNIEAGRLLEKIGAGQGKFYDWPYHLAEKTWIDIEAFIEAFQKALDAHSGKYKDKIDDELLATSIVKARDRAAQNLAQKAAKTRKG